MELYNRIKYFIAKFKQKSICSKPNVETIQAICSEPAVQKAQTESHALAKPIKKQKATKKTTTQAKVDTLQQKPLKAPCKSSVKAILSKSVMTSATTSKESKRKLNQTTLSTQRFTASAKPKLTDEQIIEQFVSRNMLMKVTLDLVDFNDIFTNIHPDKNTLKLTKEVLAKLDPKSARDSIDGMSVKEPAKATVECLQTETVAESADLTTLPVVIVNPLKRLFSDMEKYPQCEHLSKRPRISCDSGLDVDMLSTCKGDNVILEEKSQSNSLLAENCTYNKSMVEEYLTNLVELAHGLSEVFQS